MKTQPWKARRFATSSILLLLLTLAGADHDHDRNNEFSFNGRPIDPTILEPLIGDLSGEGPKIAAVDLDGSATTKGNKSHVKVEQDQVTSSTEHGFIAYRHVGTTPGRNHVLIVVRNGGGSGVFEDLIWVKVMHDQVWDDGKKRERTSLIVLGHFTLGDRDGGAVKIDGTKLFIGKSKYREKDVTVDLD